MENNILMSMESAYYVILIFIMTIITLLYLFKLVLKLKKENFELSNDLNFVNKFYLTRQGTTSTYSNKPLNYLLKSFDGGMVWYCCEWNDDNDGLNIIGNVDNIYPGLMAHLKGWDELNKYCSSHGPIDPKNLTPELKKILTDCKIAFV